MDSDVEPLFDISIDTRNRESGEISTTRDSSGGVAQQSDLTRTKRGKSHGGRLELQETVTWPQTGVRGEESEGWKRPSFSQSVKPVVETNRGTNRGHGDKPTENSPLLKDNADSGEIHDSSLSINTLHLAPSTLYN